MTFITLYGGAGNIGQRVLAEALNRGHSVTAVVREPNRLTLEHPNLDVVLGDVLDAASVEGHAARAEAVISAVPPPRVEGANRESKSAALLAIARGPVEGIRSLPTPRPYLVIVGGAGTLEAMPGMRLVDAPTFPAVAKFEALAHVDVLDYLHTVTDLDWTYLAPSAVTSPGERTGVFRLTDDALLRDERGESRISMEDFAVALLDEVESRDHVGRKFGAGY